MNQAYDALMDLVSILDIPAKAISLNGSLGLGFGSRGHGWASAHFERDLIVINLTKTRGAGALAHEWFHALDNYFSRMRGAETKDAAHGYITQKPEPMFVRKDGKGAPILKADLERIRKSNPRTSYWNEDQWHSDPKHPQGVRPVANRLRDPQAYGFDVVANRIRNAGGPETDA